MEVTLIGCFVSLVFGCGLGYLGIKYIEGCFDG